MLRCSPTVPAWPTASWRRGRVRAGRPAERHRARRPRRRRRVQRHGHERGGPALGAERRNVRPPAPDQPPRCGADPWDCHDAVPGRHRRGERPPPSLGSRRALLQAAHTLLVVLVLQGAIGYTQYFTGVPPLLVGLHVFGACLVWLAALDLPLFDAGAGAPSGRIAPCRPPHRPPNRSRPGRPRVTPTSSPTSRGSCWSGTTRSTSCRT